MLNLIFTINKIADFKIGAIYGLGIGLLIVLVYFLIQKRNKKKN
jgi:tetrahydromethanopterin S-methyltransferase subunit G